MLQAYVVILFILWFGFWYFYNFVLLKKNISTEKNPDILSYIYISFSVLIILLARLFSYTKYLEFQLLMIIVFVIASLINRDRYMGRISNSTFQLVWLLSFVEALNANLIGIALVFWIGHLPIFLIQHMTFSGKLLVFSLSFIGGLLLSFELTQFQLPYNLLIAIATHFIFYYLLRPYDNKHGWGIIN